MRLLNTHDLRLKSFDGDMPPYAILSHTWGKDEVTFQEMMMENRESAATKRKAGWKKIFGACRYARKYDFEWIWIDTCCINKESSAELSEAINSMYAYYEDAQVCYVYLGEAVCSEDIRDAGSGFRRCKWFTRGWTLQELLAPSYVVFLDQDWEMIGTRYSLADVISSITSIPVSIFRDGDFDKFSVAQKMSWAALRQTTRPEDMAYCLLGIFRVSMSPIYGEGGARAFMRLQQEIINISDDRSIFAWVAPYGEIESRGLLARSPFEFRMSGEVKASEADDIGDTSFSFGNNGLRIHLPLVPVESNSAVVTETAKTQRSPKFNLGRRSRVSAADDTTERFYPVGTKFFAPLHCRSDRDPKKWFAVYLQKAAEGRYVRYRPNQLPIPTPTSQPPDLHQVVVKENGIPRKVKNDQTDIDPGEDKKGMKETSVKIICRPAIPTKTWAIANLIYKYRCAESDDIFFIDLGFQDQAFLRFSMRSYSEHSPQWINDPCLDWMQFPLKGAGLVSVTYQMTGDQTLRIFEVRLGFVVPSMIREKVEYSYFEKTHEAKEFQPTNVFPTDFFGKELTDRTYVDMSALEEREQFRVLTYTAPPNTNPKDTTPTCAYVVIGFHESKAWMDIVVSTASPKKFGGLIRLRLS
ncbi:hypothetical protein D9758_015194 [Tetrapyrgos nigripes]|uniref:Heterokaryon incompatibility domain-containing protein n=1 Tax=Tetrapyrgos nigripes TaxID=182062 RepID=A0A8H5FDZ2_9AGAR|nr:hypothetical protein D9758_015194 [Tetrapyrgos nigripes]